MKHVYTITNIAVVKTRLFLIGSFWLFKLYSVVGVQEVQGSELCKLYSVVGVQEVQGSELCKLYSVVCVQKVQSSEIVSTNDNTCRSGKLTFIVINPVIVISVISIK